IITKIGYDFPDEYVIWLSKNQLNFVGEFRSHVKPTTRFKIVLKDGERELYLQARCEDIQVTQLESLSFDGMIISPIVSEIDLDFLQKASKASPIIYLDPQGFLREFDSDGKCYLRTPKYEVEKWANIIKVDSEEAFFITGQKDLTQASLTLRRKGINIVIATSKQSVLLFDEKNGYKIPIPEVKVVDTTGAGDIFAGAFVTTYLKCREPLWSACVATACSSLSVQYKGLMKIPESNRIHSEAEVLYNNVQSIHL
ncbi:MAG: PfkB family carbohydrate kinase, partial [Nitrososphaerales archaeon]|nr:PfkB family carbohydrate kinase [Nitrososphaerales archaeon]